MQGLELSEKYFYCCGEPMIAKKFENYKDKIAAGLIGDGSECFGFDDELSRDHDWGPSFCLWLTMDDYIKIGKLLKEEIKKLPKSFGGYEPRKLSEYGENRVGVFETRDFFRSFIGLNRLPESINEWFSIPEESFDAISLVFLLNREYKPFFKWMHRAVKYLPILGEYIYFALNDMVCTLDYLRKHEIIEEICQVIIQEFYFQGLSESKSDFLLEHGPAIQKQIKDPGLRKLNVWAG